MFPLKRFCLLLPSNPEVLPVTNYFMLAYVHFLASLLCSPVNSRHNTSCAVGAPSVFDDDMCELPSPEHVILAGPSSST